MFSSAYPVLRAWTLIGALSAAATSAAAQTGDVVNERAERLTDLVVELMPFGRMMEFFMERDATWPLKAKASAVTPEQLNCIRSGLSAASYRRQKAKEVDAYLASNPSRYQGDISVLEGGASLLIGKLIWLGADSAVSGREDVKVEDVLKSASAAQLTSMTTFIYDPKYEALRELSGVGDTLSAGKSKDESRKRGEGLGASLGAALMFKALDACQVPPATIF